MGFPKPKKEETFIPITGTIDAETQKAYLVTIGDDKLWLPKSQMREVGCEGDTLTCLVAEWIAKEKGII